MQCTSHYTIRVCIFSITNFLFSFIETSPAARIVQVQSQHLVRHSISNILNICCVCGDRARLDGKCYGVNCCHGCARFFGRWLDKSPRVYKCWGLLKGACRISRESRKNCQHCRLKRCLDVGMVRCPRPIRNVEVEMP